jgi:hypothetical protein
MGVILVGNYFIKCDSVVSNVEIYGTSIILRVRYEKRVWSVFCYRSIGYLTVQCVRANAEHCANLKNTMIQCLTLLQLGIRDDDDVARIPKKHY